VAAAWCLPLAAALGKASVLLALLRQPPLGCGGVGEQALSFALSGRQLVALTALLHAGMQPTAAHISQAAFTCQPQALRAMLAVARPLEPPPRFGIVDLRSAAFSSRLSCFLHQSLLLAAEVRLGAMPCRRQRVSHAVAFIAPSPALQFPGTREVLTPVLPLYASIRTCHSCILQPGQPGTPVERLQVVEALVAAGYRLSAYVSVLVRLPGGAERRYERFDPATDL